VTSLINLSKTAKSQLEKKQIFGEKAQVVVVLDISASMSGLYSRGIVQQLTDRLLAIGMNLDVDKSIDVFTFGERATEISSVTEGNHANFVRDSILSKYSFEYGTRYATVMKKVIDKYSAKKGFFKSATAEHPTFVFFITDGDNSDKPEAERLIKEASKQAIFWQFVGLGSERFSFLQKLDDMPGRFLDNADFFSVQDLSRESDEQLYDKLLTEFPSWIKQARAKGILQ